MITAPALVNDTLSVQVPSALPKSTVVGSLGNLMRKSAPDLLKKRPLPQRESSVFPNVDEVQEIEQADSRFDTLSVCLPQCFREI